LTYDDDMCKTEYAEVVTADLKRCSNYQGHNLEKNIT
jgi:hypothetical protein